MIDMKEDSVYVRGIWVPMGHERINDVLQIKDPKNGSKYKNCLEIQSSEDYRFSDGLKREVEFDKEESP